MIGDYWSDYKTYQFLIPRGDKIIMEDWVIEKGLLVHDVYNVNTHMIVKVFYYLDESDLLAFKLKFGV